MFAYMKKGKKEIHKDINRPCTAQDESGFIAFFWFIKNLNTVYSKNGDIDVFFCVGKYPCKADNQSL